jgi:hypothetical protein
VPLPPPTTTAPYDSLESCLNVARTRVNDAIQSIGGDILTDVQPFTATMVNSAWRKLQAYLANLGYSKYKRKFFGIALPVTATYDPSQSNIWTWSYYFDGVSYWTPDGGTSVLPQDLICPLYLRERQTGTFSPFYGPDKGRLRMMPDGLIETRKMPWNGQWEWKNDCIYLPGSTYSMDIEVEYAAYDYDFVVTDNILGNPAESITPFNMQVPIMRSQSALANYIAAELLVGRDDTVVAGLIADGQTDAKLIMNNEVKLKQRTPVQRRSYRSRGGRAYGSMGY